MILADLSLLFRTTVTLVKRRFRLELSFGVVWFSDFGVRSPLAAQPLKSKWVYDHMSITLIELVEERFGAYAAVHAVLWRTTRVANATVVELGVGLRAQFDALPHR